jgi:hypothetical protein
MDAAGEDTAVTDEGVFVGQAGCVAGKPARRSSALHVHFKRRISVSICV